MYLQDTVECNHTSHRGQVHLPLSSTRSQWFALILVSGLQATLRGSARLKTCSVAGELLEGPLVENVRGLNSATYWLTGPGIPVGPALTKKPLCVPVSDMRLESPLRLVHRTKITKPFDTSDGIC